MNNKPVNPEFKNKFEESSRIGNTGEAIFEHWWKIQHPSIELVSTTKNPDFFYKDIDYVARYAGNTERTIELKTDNNSWSKNFAIEIVANEERNRPGWLWTSEAEVLAYFFLGGCDNGDPNLWFMDMKKLREFVEQYGHRFQVKVAQPEQQLRSTETKTTKVLLLPRSVAPYLKAWHIETKQLVNSHSAQAVRNNS